MNNYNLTFISNEDLFHHVKETVLKYRFNIDLKEFNKNLVDPIKLTFDCKVYQKDLPSLINNEIMRQIDKSNTNHIGYFHQNIFKYLGNDWNVPKEGFDIVNENLKIFVEMKNKHNTMNSSSSQKTYMNMQNKILKEPNGKCFLVEVIAKNSQNIAWSISLNGQSISDERIRRVSIDKFYELVTGKTEAFKMLCEKLPMVISDVLSSIEDEIMQNSVFEELQSISPNILKSLYLLSFSKYEGFDKFQL
ncbi:MAG: Eco47II family restriction endonuclease [Campylobacterales bacterium]|nr:Eco47II family restriction endonuclease [Campylobacterales bacterium]